MKNYDFLRSIFSDGASVLLLRLGKDARIRESYYEFSQNPAIRMPIDYSLIPEGSLWLPIPKSEQYFEMDGQNMLDVIKQSELERMLVGLTNVNGEGGAVVSHQGSKNTTAHLKDLVDQIEMDLEVSNLSLRDWGNPACASTFLELDHRLSQVPFRKGQIAKLVGIGAGVGMGVVDLEILRNPN